VHGLTLLQGPLACLSLRQVLVLMFTIAYGLRSTPGMPKPFMHSRRSCLPRALLAFAQTGSARLRRG